METDQIAAQRRTEPYASELFGAVTKEVEDALKGPMSPELRSRFSRWHKELTGTPAVIRKHGLIP